MRAQARRGRAGESAGAELADAHALPAVTVNIRETPEAWQATLRPRRRSPAVMMAVVRSLVEDTELCSEGPAMLVCSDAQAAELVCGGAEAMQHVARAEACVVMVKAQSSRTGKAALAQPKVKKAPVVQTFTGPVGEYQLPVPKNFNEAMAGMRCHGQGDREVRGGWSLRASGLGDGAG